MGTYQSQDILVATATSKPTKYGATARYAYGAFYSISGALLSRLILFVQGIFIARHLGVELFGIFSVVTGAAALMTSFAGFSLGFALMKFLPEHLTSAPKKAESVLLHCVMAAIVSAIMMGLAFFFLAPVLAGGIYHRPDLILYFRLSSLMVMALAFFNISTAILIGFQKFKDYAWRMSAGYAVQLVAVWIGGTLFSLVGILIGLVVGPVIGSAILLNGGSEAAAEYGLRLHWNDYRWSWPVMRSILNFSVPSQLAGFLGTPVLWIVSTILTLRKGFIEVGLFSAAYVFYQAVLFVAQNFSLPALPVLSEIQATGDKAHFNRALNRNLRASWSLTLPICFMVAALGRGLVSLVYGKRYEGSGDIVLFTSFSGLWYVMSYALSIAIMSLGKMWDILLFNGVWSAMVIALSWKLSVAHGSIGVAAAYFISYFLLVMMAVPYSAWRFGFRFEGIERMILFSFVTIATAYAITVYLHPAASWILSAVLGPTVIWIQWKLIINEEDRNFIKSSARSLILRLFPQKQIN